MMNFNEWLLLRYYYEVGKQPDGTTDASAYTPTLVQMVRDKVEVIRKHEALQEKYKRLKKQVPIDAEELVALVGHCDDPECKGKWCVTARAFIEKYSNK